MVSGSPGAITCEVYNWVCRKGTRPSTMALQLGNGADVAVLSRLVGIDSHHVRCLMVWAWFCVEVWLVVVVVDAHDSAHLACVKCVVASCTGNHILNCELHLGPINSSRYRNFAIA